MREIAPAETPSTIEDCSRFAVDDFMLLVQTLEHYRSKYLSQVDLLVG